ncbi:unnamed protein product [Victoria cruziana]
MFQRSISASRYSSHIGILINVPFKNHDPTVAPEYVARIVSKSCDFSLRWRAFYLSFSPCLWIFGRALTFLFCEVMVCLLYVLDISQQPVLTGAQIENAVNG